MKVKNLVKNSALILGKFDVIRYINGATDSGIDTLESVNLLTNLCTLVVDELSSTYLPLIRRETVTFGHGKHPLNTFRETIIKILAVYDMDNKKVDFTIDEYYVWANVSKCNVEYEYAPKNYDLDDEIGYSEKDISISTLAYGVAAEYCITQGQFEQAVMHHKRYVDNLAEICLPKNKMIKSRSWV